MVMKLYINSVLFNRSLTDGPGLRTVVFFQGCDLHCEGCHNPSLWDIDSGTEIDVDELADFIIQNSINKKITISGGEPLMQKEALVEFLKKLKGFDIVLYTGHEEIEVPEEIFAYITYLKSGSYKRELKTTVIPYVGSSNQRFRRIRNEKNQ